MLLLSASSALAMESDAGLLISDLKVDPSAGHAGTIYTISLRITMPKASDQFVPLLHQLREGLEAMELPLNDEGRDGDLSRGDGIYSGQTRVPDTAARQAHRFEVFVRDQLGRKSNVLAYWFRVLEGVKI